MKADQETDDTQDTDSDGGLSLKVFADLSLAIGELRDQTKALRKEQARLAAQPNVVTFEQMAISAAGGSMVVDMGGQACPAGRMWVVRLFGVVASPFAANASVLTWYIGQNIPGPAAGQLPATWSRWQQNVPNFQNFTSNVHTVMPNQRLLAGLTAMPASTSLALIAVVNDLPLHGPLSVVSGD